MGGIDKDNVRARQVRGVKLYGSGGVDVDDCLARNAAYPFRFSSMPRVILIGFGDAELGSFLERELAESLGDDGLLIRGEITLISLV
jgi:hypothetical protein